MQRDAGLTTIMVTHDQDEAMAMADRVVVMKDGFVQQTGTQEDVYERPATRFRPAGFIGRANLLPGSLGGGSVVTVDGAPVHVVGRYAASGSSTLALRPERLALASPGTTGPGSVRGTVELASYLGASREHLVRIGPDRRVLVRDTTTGPARLRSVGEAVAVTWDIGAERLFDSTDAPLPNMMTETLVRMTSDV